jgi:hypothetical protein
MDNQLKQANMMVARSKKELGIPEVGQTVAIPIPLLLQYMSRGGSMILVEG